MPPPCFLPRGMMHFRAICDNTTRSGSLTIARTKLATSTPPTTEKRTCAAAASFPAHGDFNKLFTRSLPSTFHAQSEKRMLQDSPRAQSTSQRGSRASIEVRLQKYQRILPPPILLYVNVRTFAPGFTINNLVQSTLTVADIEGGGGGRVKRRYVVKQKRHHRFPRLGSRITFALVISGERKYRRDIPQDDGRTPCTVND